MGGCVRYEYFSFSKRRTEDLEKDLVLYYRVR